MFNKSGVLAALAAGLLIQLTATPAQASDAKVEHCSKNLGTLAVVEQPGGYANLSSYGLGSPAALLRQMIQESGCFDVVERGAGMENMQQERELAAAGQMKQGSNIGGGQMQVADFVLTPTIQVTGDDSGSGVASSLLGRMGSLGSLVGDIAGGLKFKSASTSLTLADVRSGIQVASAQGAASKSGIDLGALGGAMGGDFANTPEGKVIAASLVDNYNKIVLAIRDKSSLVRTDSASSNANAAASTQSTMLQPPPAAPVPVAQAPVMVVPPPVFVGGGLNGGFDGIYDITFSGLDKGSFTVSAASTGLIQGTGNSEKRGSFKVAGRFMDSNGSFVMVVGDDANKALFQGRIDKATGAVTGVWNLEDGTVGGAIKGQQQK